MTRALRSSTLPHDDTRAGSSIRPRAGRLRVTRAVTRIGRSLSACTSPCERPSGTERASGASSTSCRERGWSTLPPCTASCSSARDAERPNRLAPKPCKQPKSVARIAAVAVWSARKSEVLRPAATECGRNLLPERERVDLLRNAKSCEPREPHDLTGDSDRRTRGRQATCAAAAKP